MHMADALLSPQVGGAMWAATAATTVYCARRVRQDPDEGKVPLMGVLGAFIFAAQMLNFSIPGTGSSGHLGGGLILAALLGPPAAFLVMASVLTVQALFFADGGLLALGANIFNLGFFPAFIAYPLIYRPITGDGRSRGRLIAGSLAAAIVGLLAGAVGVVLQTTLSGVSELPIVAFGAAMLPIHLAIGLVEGLATAAVVLFVRRAQPELLERAATGRALRGLRLGRVLVGLAVAAVVAGGALAWFASSAPDGLEWSIARVAGVEELAGRESAARSASESMQERSALLPGYGLPDAEESAAGTSVAGLAGAAITLAVAAAVGIVLRRRSARRAGGVG